MLLHNTNIEAELSKRDGKIARVGGTVNQLFTYTNCVVQDFNVLDGGYGNVSSWKSITDAKQAFNVIKRQTWQEIRHIVQGDKVPLDRKPL